MRHAILALFILILTGCSIPPSVRFDLPPTRVAPFTYTDKRPPEQRVSRIESDQHGMTTYFGDDKLFPAPDKLVQTSLQRVFGERLAGLRVTLNHFALSVREDSVSWANPAWLDQDNAVKAVTIDIRIRIGERDFFASVKNEFHGKVTEADLQEMLRKALIALNKNVRAWADPDPL